MPYPNISMVIKERRLQLGLSLEKVAKQLGVDRATVCRWESGKINTIKRSHIYLLSNILNIPIELLLGLDYNGDIEDPEITRKRFEVIDSLNSIKSKEDLEQVEKFIKVFIKSK